MNNYTIKENKMKTLTIKIYQDQELLHTIPTDTVVKFTEDGTSMTHDVIAAGVDKARAIMGSQSYDLVFESQE